MITTKDKQEDTKTTSYTVTEDNEVLTINGVMTLGDFYNLIEWLDRSQYMSVDIKIGPYEKVATVTEGSEPQGLDRDPRIYTKYIGSNCTTCDVLPIRTKKGNIYSITCPICGDGCYSPRGYPVVNWERLNS